MSILAYAIRSETRYTVTTNLEDTPEHLAPFAIERSRGVILTSSFLSAAFHVRATGRRSRNPKLANPSQDQEFTMSARNGDKSRFNRQRKQNIARRKRAQELLRRIETHTSAQAKVAAQPRSVSA